MTKEEQITKDQHFVPQFYLKKFTNINGKLEILDCNRKKIVVSRTPKNVCNEEYFYSANNKLDDISQNLEKDFQKIESEVSSKYDEITKRFIDLGNINKEDRMIISTFMSLQYLRGPYMRMQVNKMTEKFIKDTVKLRFSLPDAIKVLNEFEGRISEKLSEDQKKEIIKQTQEGEYSLELGNIYHLRMIGEIKGFRNLLLAKEWKVYISESNKKFITSDNPVVELFPDWTGKFFYGPSFSQRTHQFALTPEILIIATNIKKNPSNIGGLEIVRLSKNQNDNKRINNLNIECARNSILYAYSNNKKDLQDIIDIVKGY